MSSDIVFFWIICYSSLIMTEVFFIQLIDGTDYMFT